MYRIRTHGGRAGSCLNRQFGLTQAKQGIRWRQAAKTLICSLAIASLVLSQTPVRAYAELAAVTGDAFPEQTVAVNGGAHEPENDETAAAVPKKDADDTTANEADGEAGNADRENDPETTVENNGQGEEGNEPDRTEAGIGSTGTDGGLTAADAGEDPQQVETQQDAAETAQPAESKIDADARTNDPLTFSVIVDTPEMPNTPWVEPTEVDFTEGVTLSEFVKAQLAAAGLEAKYFDFPGMPTYFFISSITHDGISLPLDPNQTFPCWTIFINGTQYNRNTDGTRVLNPGDDISVVHTSSNKPPATIAIGGEVIGFDSDPAADDSPVPKFWAADIKTNASLSAGGEGAVRQILQAAGLDFQINDSGEHPYLESVSSLDETVTLTSDAPADDGTVAGRCWTVYLDGKKVSCWLDALGDENAPLEAGSKITLYYSDGADTLPEADEGLAETEPDAPRPDWKPEHGGFSDGRVSEGGSPTSAEQTELAWSWNPGNSEGTIRLSSPIIAGGRIFVADSSTLTCLDEKTGKVVKSVQLLSRIDSTCRPIYANGLIVVPLANGRLQAFTADGLICTWYTKQPVADGDDGQQILSSLSYADGRIYFATVGGVGASQSSSSGLFSCIDAKTGKTLWSFENRDAGYYWSEPLVCKQGRFVVIAGDDGNLTSFATSSASGQSADAKSAGVARTPTGSIALGAPVRSSIALDEQGNLYAITVDGTVHRIRINDDGSFTELASKRVLSASTASPIVIGDKLIVAGTGWEKNGFAYCGALAILDRETLSTISTVEQTADGSLLPAEIKSSPVISVQGSNAYVYFTCNALPGGIYIYRLGDDSAQALFTPEDDDAQWCDYTIVFGSDGRLYYSNDSGTLFALQAKAQGNGDGDHNETGNENGGVDNKPADDEDTDTEPLDKKDANDERHIIATGAPIIPLIDAASQNEQDASANDAASKQDDALQELTTEAMARGIGNESRTRERASSLLPMAGVAVSAGGIAVAGFLAIRKIRLRR